MRTVPTRLPDVLIVEPVVHGDHRGFFMETWNQRTFAALGIHATFVQDNHSRSAAGTLRGLHYQLQRPQGKLVRVLRGEVFDVAVDIRRSSPTFGQWVGVTLSEANRRMLWVPPGFAHGFLVTSDVADVAYKCTELYAPDDERSVRWDDRDIAVAWPLDDDRAPILSARDAEAPTLAQAQVYP